MVLQSKGDGYGPASALAFAAGGRLVSRGGGGSNFGVWTLAKPGDVRRVKATAPGEGFPLPDGVRPVGARPKLAVSPDGRRFAAPLQADFRNRDRIRLGIWDIDSGNLVESFELLKAGPLTAVAFTPDGTTVAVGDVGGKVWLVDVATKAVPRALDGHRGPITCLAVSADGKQLASGSSDTTVLIWNLPKP